MTLTIRTGESHIQTSATAMSAQETIWIRHVADEKRQQDSVDVLSTRLKDQSLVPYELEPNLSPTGVAEQIVQEASEQEDLPGTAQRLIAMTLTTTLQPTYFGHIATKRDACLLLQACLSGQLHHTSRLPWEDELQNVVCSGNIFVYTDIHTGTGRWNDGRDWAFLGREDGFLVEREHFGGDSLFKKSGSIVVQGVAHYVVSYYKAKDTVKSSPDEGDTLVQPSQDASLQSLLVRHN